MRAKLLRHLAWLDSLYSHLPTGETDPVLLYQIVESRKYFQHERSIHLAVTIAIGIFLMFVLYLAISRDSILFAGLLIIVAVLETAYIVHYYHLENGVQRLWEAEWRIIEKCGSKSGTAS